MRQVVEDRVVHTPDVGKGVGWVGVAGLVIGGGVLAVSGHPEMGALAGAASMIAASWMLRYRGRVHRWPSLLKDARDRNSADR